MIYETLRFFSYRFLSKSFLGFLAFNVVSYSLLLAELFLVWRPPPPPALSPPRDEMTSQGNGGAAGEGREHDDFYIAHIFNGCYAFLMFVVVIFFLIYGVEVFFKVSIQF